jgi:shikimate kinase
MTAVHPTDAQPTLSTADVKALLREIGHVLWLSRKLAAEMKRVEPAPVRPEMAEFCAIDMAACAA